jgi:hypothetical protein
MSELQESHDAQLGALQAQLLAERDRAALELSNHIQARQTRRVQYVERITTDDTALAREIARATSVDAPIIGSTATTVEIKRPAILALLVNLQQAQEQVIHERTYCDLRISEMRLEILPTSLENEQRLEVRILRLTQENDLEKRHVKQLETAISGVRADVVTWSVVSGVVGLVVGAAVVGGVAFGVGIGN